MRLLSQTETIQYHISIVSVLCYFFCVSTQNEVSSSRRLPSYISANRCRSYHEYPCAGSESSCISHQAVCDGVRDCPQADDERLCALAVPPGSVWDADIYYDNCSFYQPLSVRLKIQKVDTLDSPSYPRVDALVYLTHNRTGAIRTSETQLTGRYSYANRMLWVTTDIGDGVYMRCLFDGVHWDRCQGALHTADYTVADWNPCCEFTYYRSCDTGKCADWDVFRC